MPEDMPPMRTREPGDSLDWEAVARFLAGESSPQESERIRALIASRPEDQALVTALERATAKMPDSIPSDIDVESALARVKARRDADVHSITTARSARRDRWRLPAPLFAVAATLLVAITGWLMLRDKSPSEPIVSPPRGFATGIGARDSIRLADGSLMVIGPASFASVAVEFGKTERRVDVRGDVYFEVVHKESSPFVVHAGTAIIRDVGTRFAVRSDTANGVTVAVAEGAVSLSADAGASPHLLLQAGQRGAVRRDRPPERLGTGTVDDDLAWMHGQLVFRESPMSEVVSSLQRWYGINLRFEDPSFAIRHFTGTFSGEPPERVLDVIRLALGARLDRRGDTVFVRSLQSERGGTRSR